MMSCKQATEILSLRRRPKRIGRHMDSAKAFLCARLAPEWLEGGMYTAVFKYLLNIFRYFVYVASLDS